MLHTAQVHIQRSLKEKEENDTSSVAISDESSSRHIPLLLKSKLLIVDLAGSERIDKSGMPFFYTLDACQ